MSLWSIAFGLMTLAAVVLSSAVFAHLARQEGEDHGYHEGYRQGYRDGWSIAATQQGRTDGDPDFEPRDSSGQPDAQ